MLNLIGSLMVWYKIQNGSLSVMDTHRRCIALKVCMDAKVYEITIRQV